MTLPNMYNSRRGMTLNKTVLGIKRRRRRQRGRSEAAGITYHFIKQDRSDFDFITTIFYLLRSFAFQRVCLLRDTLSCTAIWLF